MKKIISVSRRTDIPAFYGEWFLKRLDEGFAGWENPFGGQKYLVSLKPEDVMAFVFWSKNYRPFLPAIKRVKETGYPVMFNYTITGLPKIFECNLVDIDDAIDSFREISRLYSREHINWRYDPIVTSNRTNENYHIEKFHELAEKLKGYTKRCYFSFAIMYGKVERNFKKFEQKEKVGFFEMEQDKRIALANKLADIAEANGITMHSCCGDYLINKLIKKAHCVDGELLEKLYPQCTKGVERPTRKECGCTESTDIGKYDTCPHGCIYCYANVNKDQAEKAYKSFDKESVFFGFTKMESEQFIKDINLIKIKKISQTKNQERQPRLF